MKKIMNVVIESSGAQHGYLLIAEEGSLFVRAESHIGEKQVQTVNQKLDDAPTICKAIVRYVYRTGERVILDNASQEGMFKDKPEVQELQLCSVLCLPVINQSKIIGIIYLENRLSDAVFTAGKTQMTELLMSQAAISLENSRLVREDIAERKRAEEKLRSASLYARSLIEASLDPLVTISPKGKITDVNEATVKAIGIPRDRLVGTDFSDYFTEPGKAREGYRKVFENGFVTDYPLTIRHKDGKLVDVLYNASVYKDVNSKVLGVFAVARDVTALRESEERYRRIVETATEGIWVIDKTCRTTFANKKMAEMLACTAEEMIGKSLYDFIDDEWIAEADRNVECSQQGISEQHEFMFRRKDGKELWTFLSVNPLIDLNGQYTSSLAMVTDITGRKQFEKEMARLDRLNMIGQMAAGIGHEIRNPMTTVRGFLQMLGWKEECTKFKSHFDLMIEELDRANSIITEFLSLARNKVIDKKPTNLNAILESLLPLMQADAMKSDKYVIVKLGEIANLLLDEKEIRQVILNLVRNGLEASPPSSDLLIRTFTDGEEVVLAVQDKGEGIKPDVLEKVGTPFFTTKDNGTGLGLAVCYSIAARHDAKIEIEAGLKGTTFFVRF